MSGGVYEETRRRCHDAPTQPAESVIDRSRSGSTEYARDVAVEARGERAALDPAVTTVVHAAPRTASRAPTTRFSKIWANFSASGDTLLAVQIGMLLRVANPEDARLRIPR
jgi:hypothetical protein